VSSSGRLTLTVVTPERSVVERVACDAVSLPGELGELGILPGHTPLVSLLAVGRVTWTDGAGRPPWRSAEASPRSRTTPSASSRTSPPRRTRSTPPGARGVGAGDGRRLAVVGREELDAVNADIAYAEAKLAVAQGS
jgi:F0F1-type ATP synthase, epsilon subunit (mitochondrial delta subunit)